ncbi:hypothetical protein IWW36_001258 [Coemansia brasiliensis]|uniref:Glutaredoxin domain-containing protein n=1 Tax=Coemansia brasiliensis TaxID=2650707 RepID=A0A9W8IH18_9FUNG|nr:hypothetical protein IWW36_001258 [Coemansia brasiliensis]
MSTSSESVIVEAKLVDEAVEVSKPVAAENTAASDAKAEESSAFETVKESANGACASSKAADIPAVDNSESVKTNNHSTPKTESIPANKDAVNEDPSVTTEHPKDQDVQGKELTVSSEPTDKLDNTDGKDNSAAKALISAVELEDAQDSVTSTTVAADSGNCNAIPTEQTEQVAEQLSNEAPEPMDSQSQPTTSEKAAETIKEVVSEQSTSDNTPKDKPKETDEALVRDTSKEDVEIERPRVRVYGSTVSGNRTYKKQVKELFAMLEAIEVDFEYVCIAADEQAKKFVRRKALGNMTIPQIYVDDELKGFYEDAFNANEVDELYEWLGLDEEPIDY